MTRAANTSRFRPLDALRALRALMNDPDDTGQVFKVIAALSGNTRERMVGRMERYAEGRRLLRERPALLPRLADREGLRRLPEGSLGRAYLRFCEQNGLTAEGLIAASKEGVLHGLGEDELYMHARMRDSHDLFHVLTGYQTDLLGEACVLAFTVAQTRNPGIALIVTLAYLRPRGEHAYARTLLPRALVRGLRASWLPAVHWEELLARPLDEVRRELGVDAPPTYKPVWPHEIYPHKAPRAMNAA